MKHFLIAMLVAAVTVTTANTALAADVGLSMNIGQP